jgi:glycosyltransferase involved in cell wall biosynthesis
MPATVTDNARWSGAQPAISVLTPFMRHDPSALLRALDRDDAKQGTEIVVLDDGTQEDALADRVRGTVESLATPARFVRSTVNEGRARARNRLAANARGRYLLFLDSDMLPDAPTFLARYHELVRDVAPPVAFGGFSVRQCRERRDTALHKYLTSSSDCIPPAERSKRPEKYVFTSNLLVRRDVFERFAFDEKFEGWGWEDVEWAMRVSRAHPILHVENPATHLGLETVDRLIAKYRESAKNFEQVLRRHPDYVKRYPVYRAASLVKRLPARAFWRSAFATCARAELPLRLRTLSLKLYRAALYADVV